MLGLQIKDEDYFGDEDAIWLNFEELYQLYHKDALGISFFSTWLL
jgi:plasmid maintenance system antidote protein VapI